MRASGWSYGAAAARWSPCSWACSRRCGPSARWLRMCGGARASPGTRRSSGPSIGSPRRGSTGSSPSRPRAVRAAWSRSVCWPSASYSPAAVGAPRPSWPWPMAAPWRSTGWSRSFSIAPARTCGPRPRPKRGTGSPAGTPWARWACWPRAWPVGLVHALALAGAHRRGPGHRGDRALAPLPGCPLTQRRARGLGGRARLGRRPAPGPPGPCQRAARGLRLVAVAAPGEARGRRSGRHAGRAYGVSGDALPGSGERDGDDGRPRHRHDPRAAVSPDACPYPVPRRCARGRPCQPCARASSAAMVLARRWY